MIICFYCLHFVRFRIAKSIFSVKISVVFSNQRFSFSVKIVFYLGSLNNLNLF